MDLVRFNFSITFFTEIILSLFFALSLPPVIFPSLEVQIALEGTDNFYCYLCPHIVTAIFLLENMQAFLCQIYRSQSLISERNIFKDNLDLSGKFPNL